MAQRSASRSAANTDTEQAPWREFVEARGGYYAHRHDGTFSHAHAAHGLATFDAATGRLLGVFGGTIDEGGPTVETCPICSDFKREEWP